MLTDIIPFRFLNPDQRASLEADLTEVSYAAGQVLIEQGDTSDDRVFILRAGTVEIFDRAAGEDEPIGVIDPGHYFGERASLFDTPRKVEVRAAGPVTVWTLPGERFVGLVDESSSFALALAKILRDKHGIFVAFDRFRAE